MLIWAALYVAIVNVWTIASFHDDKRRAVAGRRRIPEGSLLLLAFIGGSPGAFAARRMFRHKTRKEPFSTELQMIAAVHVGAVFGLLVLS